MNKKKFVREPKTVYWSRGLSIFLGLVFLALCIFLTMISNNAPDGYEGATNLAPPGVDTREPVKTSQMKDIQKRREERALRRQKVLEAQQAVSLYATRPLKDSTNDADSSVDQVNPDHPEFM